VVEFIQNFIDMLDYITTRYFLECVFIAGIIWSFGLLFYGIIIILKEDKEKTRRRRQKKK
jgi:hypothetical protein